MPIYVSQWEGREETVVNEDTGLPTTYREWRGPGGPNAALNLRSRPQKATWPAAEGAGVFIYDTPQNNRGAVYLGDDPNARMTVARRNSLADYAGVRRAALPDASLAVIMGEFLLGSLADPTGQTAVRPLGMNRHGSSIHMRQYGQVWKVPFSRAAPNFAYKLAKRKFDYVEQLKEVEAGFMTMDALRKWNGWDMLEYWGRMDSDLLAQLIPATRLDDGWRTPTTDVGDTFQAASTINLEATVDGSGTNPTTGWVLVGGSAGDVFRRDANDASLQAGQGFYVVEESMSTAAHRVSVTARNTVNGDWTGRFCGILVRALSSARTGYLGGYNRGSDVVDIYRIYDMAAGTFNLLNSADGGTDTANGNDIMLQVGVNTDDDTIELFANGDTSTVVVTTTDGDLSANRRVGIHGAHTGADRTRWSGQWVASEQSPTFGGGGLSIPVAMHNYYRQRQWRP